MNNNPSRRPMHSVIETPDFISDAKAADITEEEKSKIVSKIANDPECGDEIKGTGGARKIRFGGRGKGKSGGYRVISFYTG
jgi:mRNA-degrading endonuclease RelE of RelBE toxin-antitoxin system